jgi:hypothetical protein
MKTRWFAAAGFGALALGVAATTAQAAPVVELGAIKAHAGDTGAIEKVTWGWHRRCYWHNGYRTCDWGRHHWRRYHHHSWGWRRDWHYHHRY